MRPDRGIYERNPGSGVWWVRVADRNGRIVRRLVGSKSVARKVYSTMRAATIEGRLMVAAKPVAPTLREMCDAYRAQRVDTMSGDRKRFAQFWCDALVGHRRVDTIRAGEIERAINGTLRDKVEPQTVYHYLSFLRAAYHAAIRDGLTDATPTKGVRWPKVANRRIRFLSHDEETLLLGALKRRDQRIVLLALHTGLRQSEQFALKWADVSESSVYVRKSKSGQARHVELNATARAVLAEMREASKSQWVCENRLHGRFRTANWIKRNFLPAVEAAELVDFRYHDLRHTFASRLVMAGVDLTTVQHLLGHASVTMTQRYAHLSESHRRAAVETIVTDTTANTAQTKGDRGEYENGGKASDHAG